MTTKFRYVGPATFYRVPAGDISEEQFERMPADQRRIVLHSGAYEPVEQMTRSQLNAMTRPDLDAHAAAQGIADPDAYESKDALIKVLLGEEPLRQPTPDGGQAPDPGQTPDISVDDGEDE